MNREEAIEKWVIPALKNTWNEKRCKEILAALEQEPCIQEKQANADKIDAVYIDGFKAGYSQARFDLEQEPCDDCISRKELLKIYDGRFLELQKIKHLKDNKGAEDRQMGVNYCINILKEMPSVTPAEKVGQWEYVQYDGNPNIGNWHCSECRAIVNYKQTYNWEKKPYHKFCPMCGAKMQEVEE